MPQRTIFPEFRDENTATNYPFSREATLVNSEDRTILQGAWIDAALYPIGATAGLYLSSVVIDFQTVTLVLAAPDQPNLATATFSLVRPPEVVTFEDSYGRPAGIMVGEPVTLGFFQTWGVGTHNFTQAETEFEGTCVFPTPELGIRAIELETGDVFIGDVWLVGGDGVVLSASETVIPVLGTAQTRNITQIRIDVVGDPLFRRLLCTPQDLFQTPQFLTSVNVVGPNMQFNMVPNASGNIRITEIDDLSPDSVLRIMPTATGIEISAVGSALTDI